MRNWFYYIGILISLLFASCVESPVNWTPTYDSTHSIPYGTEVLRKELPKIFPDSKIQNIGVNTHNFFDEINAFYSYAHYMYINQIDIHTVSTWSLISNFVYDGGSAFIAIGQGNTVLLNDLGISIDSFLKVKDKQAISLSIQSGTTEKSFVAEKVFNTEYISNYNPETTDILGYLTYNGQKEPNLVKVYHGDGYFLISTTPSLFTNYQVLRKNHYQYVLNTFSYLEDADVYWDNHRMNQRSSGEKNDGGFFNGLSFIMKHESLRWAFFLLVLLGILYLFFNSKRRQRAVPIILPYSNYTLEFAKTLSELYRGKPDHTAMVRYKINYFLEQIRQKYHITSKDSEKDYAELLSSKSGVDIYTCQKIVTTIELYKTRSYLDREDFVKIQSLIQIFNHKSQAYARSNTRS